VGGVPFVRNFNVGRERNHVLYLLLWNSSLKEAVRKDSIHIIRRGCSLEGETTGIFFESMEIYTHSASRLSSNGQ
jgi:hypothetical protein